MEITVYIARLARDGFRVVAGKHLTHTDAHNATVHVYPNAQLAYANETREDVRVAILKIDPKAAAAVVGPVRVETISDDPRGPMRTIVAVGDTVATNHMLTLDCGHKPEMAQHFYYKVGTRIHCFQCGHHGSKDVRS